MPEDHYDNTHLMIMCTFLDGKLNGVYRKYYLYEKNCMSIECTFLDGKLNGEYRSWYHNGQLSRESTYVGGKRVKKRKYRHIR